ncbi:hypothetical protein D3C76_1127380 [compost metagenome]
MDLLARKAANQARPRIKVADFECSQAGQPGIGFGCLTFPVTLQHGMAREVFREQVVVEPCPTHHHALDVGEIWLASVVFDRMILGILNKLCREQSERVNQRLRYPSSTLLRYAVN